MSDGRSKYNKVCSILKPIVGQEMHINKLWRLIIIEVGATDAIVRETINLMVKLGMIHEIEPFVYKILQAK